MKKGANLLALCILASFNLMDGAAAAAGGGMIARKDFFKNIVGMDEDTFRRTYNWADGKLQAMLDPSFDLSTWINDPRYPRRKVILEGTFHFYSLRDLREKGGVVRPLSAASFEVRIHDPANPQLTDIRALQADPANNGAAFQIASTFFGPLEGGMYKWQSKLTHMLEAATQGEEANVSAAGAAIWRKYFMPTFANFPPPFGQSLPGYYYLLEYLKPKIRTAWRGGNFDIDLASVRSYRYEPMDSERVGFGLHDDVYVTSGYAPVRIGRSATDRRPSPDDLQPPIPLSANQKIAQIFTSAYNLAEARRSKPALRDTDPEAQFAQMILNASYEGTLKAAYVAKKPRLFLTLMGGGAFVNDIAWVGNALDKPEIIAFIKNAGLQITLLYRPDPRKATRNADSDIAFLERMQEMANQINGTRARISDDVKRSIMAAYGAAPAAWPGAAPGLRFEKLLTLTNGETVGWLAVDGNAVLINLGKNANPTIDPTTGAANFKYINPDVPSAVALPKGLYFWKSQNPRPEIGNRRNQTAVRHQPTTRDFRYTHPKGYLDQFGNAWDERRIRDPHPFPVSAAAVPAPTPTPPPAWLPPAPAPAPAIPTTLTFTEILRLRSGERIGWLSVGTDAVLINLGTNANPTINPATRAANFIYINPDAPLERLEQGLFFWKSQNATPAIGTGHSKEIGRRTVVKPSPDGDEYVMNIAPGGYTGYVLGSTGVPWKRMETVKKDHPF